ncbi:hypothetical protein [Aeromicrobium wangtongii]|uniref:Uncharacterized protein n=1 Tax=Aeromicrobium wangtongii TaxID=2969247 RepID=A0ABY5M818_9ACTN|nr:hypothetical protein [Aeromicrobium wangtongii]MCD9196789.1 hypothetical protein [Aeromicrobium wangtongii]UUP14299.1 hypothetical protein NQV15_02990 [Aeromicrobium wangtongii]
MITGPMRVYLHSSAEVIALEAPLEKGQRVRWFVRWPGDIAEGYGGDLATRLGIAPADLTGGRLLVEDHDCYFPSADDADAWWIEGTVSSWAKRPGDPVGSYVLVDLDDVTMSRYQ